MDIISSFEEFGIIVNIAFWFIKVCIFGMIMKHFIREGVKEALEETKLSKRKTDTTW